jgi:hypothetical protein
VISSPAIHAPLRETSLTSRLGGTLAGAPSIGHFLSPSRTSTGALCSVPLTRDARSARGRGLHCVAANRADCIRKGQGASTGHWRGRSLPPSSIPFHDAPQHLCGNNSNRHHASGGAGGAAGLVMRTLPRPFPFLQVHNVAHRHHLLSLISTGAAIPRGGQVIRAERNG